MAIDDPDTAIGLGGLLRMIRDLQERVEALEAVLTPAQRAKLEQAQRKAA